MHFYIAYNFVFFLSEYLWYIIFSFTLVIICVIQTVKVTPATLNTKKIKLLCMQLLAISCKVNLWQTPCVDICLSIYLQVAQRWKCQIPSPSRKIRGESTKSPPATRVTQNQSTLKVHPRYYTYTHTFLTLAVLPGSLAPQHVPTKQESMPPALHPPLT